MGKEKSLDTFSPHNHPKKVNEPVARCNTIMAMGY